MRVLITGGCGFIGSHLVEYHLSKGDEVHTVDNLSTGTLQNIAPFQKNSSFLFDQADILTWPDLDKAVKSADRIYHFAGVVGMFKVTSDPLSVISNNIIASNHLFQVIANSKAKPIVIISSSSSVYGDSQKSLLNENDSFIVKPLVHPLATYAISKMSDEAIALAYYRSENIPVIMARLFNTIGPRQTGRYGMVVPRFVSQACQNEPFTIFGDGEQTRSFCDVRDVVTMLDLLGQQDKAIGEAINVGNDVELSINQLAALICECTGRKNKSRHIPYNEVYGAEFTDITQRRPDLSKLRSLIKFKHKWTLSATINDLIAKSKSIIV